MKKLTLLQGISRKGGTLPRNTQPQNLNKGKRPPLLRKCRFLYCLERPDQLGGEGHWAKDEVPRTNQKNTKGFDMAAKRRMDLRGAVETCRSSGTREGNSLCSEAPRLLPGKRKKKGPLY